MWKMQKIIKFSKLLFGVRFSSTRRYQFKVAQPIYYPKRNLTEEDALKMPVQVQEPPQLMANTLMPLFEYYKILGVKKTATAQEIKTAYYKLAKKFHPDSSPTKQETKSFQKICEAYEVLNDETTRAEYDQYGKVKKKQTKQNAMPLVGVPSNTKKKKVVPSKPIFTVENHVKEIQEIKEVRVPLQETARIMNKNEVQLDVKFLDAVQGTKEYIDLKDMTKCPKCNGFNRSSGKGSIEFCQKCGGTGNFRSKKNGETEYEVCRVCDGKRVVNKNVCNTCNDKGFVFKSQRIAIEVPPGSATGDILKIQNPTTQQVIMVRLNVDKSNYFKRIGSDIGTDKYITISQAVLGGKFKIRGLYEELEVALGPGIQSHTTYCFTGKGVITANKTEPGNHIVTFKIRIPKALTTKQRQLMLAWSKAEDPSFDGQ